MALKRQKWAIGAFKTQSLRGWDLQGSKLKGISTSENQGNPLRQDFALFIECKNRVLVVRIAGQTAARVRIAGISHRSSLKDMPIFRVAGQNRRYFWGSFCGSFPVNSEQPKGFSHR